MAAAVRAHVEEIALDEGLWCRTCFLPSGVRIWFTVTFGPRMVLRTTIRCRGCGGSDVDA